MKDHINSNNYFPAVGFGTRQENINRISACISGLER